MQDERRINQWIPNPWYVYDYGKNDHNPHGELVIETIDRVPIARVYPSVLTLDRQGRPSAHARANRIVACVNGCYEIQNPEAIPAAISALKMAAYDNCQCPKSGGKPCGNCQARIALAALNGETY